MPPDLHHLGSFLKLHRFLFSYLFLVAVVVLTLAKVQINEDARNRDQARTNRIVCVQASDYREAVLRLVDALSVPTNHTPGEDPSAAVRVDQSNSAKAEARRTAAEIMKSPPCLIELGLDVDQDGKPDPDQIPANFGPPK